MDRYELAWAAGFFDGEGWAGAVAQSGRRSRQPHARINQADDVGVPEVLTRFRAAVGVGAIGGPTRTVGRRDLYRWEASNTRDVEHLYRSLTPWLGGVKLLQLAQAVHKSATRQSVPAIDDDAWWAWAAGLYDGEGCSALLRHRTHEGYFIPELSVTQSSDVGPPEVLLRFLAVVGAGTISGPYKQRNATMDVYRWKASARDDAVRVIDSLWPHLGPVKRAQAQRVLDTMAAQAPLPRGNPAWGKDKESCVNGHEYASARIRPFRPRKGGSEPRPSSQCLACLREYARAQREKKRSAADDDRRSIRETAVSYLLK